MKTLILIFNVLFIASVVQATENQKSVCGVSTIDAVEFNTCLHKAEFIEKESSYIDDLLVSEKSKQITIDFYIMSDQDLEKLNQSLSVYAQKLYGVLAENEREEFRKKDRHNTADRLLAANIKDHFFERYKSRFICEVSIMEIYEGTE